MSQLPYRPDDKTPKSGTKPNTDQALGWVIIRDNRLHGGVKIEVRGPKLSSEELLRHLERVTTQLRSAIAARRQEEGEKK